ncbi:bacterio-opsin activator domain-containing protein [Halorubrum sp. Atlit-26R]|uniref:bacterio-opsin activator domain-containing protein n=1 Tax=Halorubrum sp. Atlit-26R TaxID=2282128 RepID=UPI000EF18C5E|nr:bacterio-opsin activator domain-containing protein [Halorubrum sp. Atlit-26R]RLM72805.1 PAS domain S-box protein [Halorubrum sp. Atlit-26R]
MNWIIALSIGLRLLGVGYSVLLLASTRDRRFGFLTLLLTFMTLRQLLTVRTATTGVEELPGLVVSGLTLLTVYYLSEYVDEEDAVKARLERANERLRGFRKAIEHAGHAIFLTDPEGTIEYANPAVETVTGYEPEEVVGENPRLWQSGKHDDEFYEGLWQQIESGSVWEGELTNRRKSGELCWIDATIAPITEDGDVDRYVAIERDVTERKERELRIEDQNERLALLNNTNEVLRDVNRELVAASTRAEIEAAVCEQFASAELFDVAWTGGRGLVDGTVSPRSCSGADVDALDGHIETLCATDPTPIEAALDASRPVFTEVDDDLAGRPGESHCVVVPLAYRGAEYGVLVVMTRNADAFDLIERDIFAELGRTVADAISAVESKRTLAADSVTELEFQLTGIDEPLANVAAELDCTVDVEHVGGGDGDRVQYVTVADAEPEAVSEYAAGADGVDAAQHVYTHEGRSLFRFSLGERSIVATLAQYGAGVESLSVAGTSGTLVAHVASSNDIRSVVDALQTAYDGLTLVAQRERERDVQTEAGFRKQLAGALTDRQREAARTAHYAGFFEWPREHTGEEVASMMDISQTTFTQHLRAAENKLFAALFDDAVTVS